MDRTSTQSQVWLRLRRNSLKLETLELNLTENKDDKKRLYSLTLLNIQYSVQYVQYIHESFD